MAQRGLAGAMTWARSAVLGAPTHAQKTVELGQKFAAELSDIARDHGPTLVKKGVSKARSRVSKLPFPSQVSSLFGGKSQDWDKAKAS